MGGVGPDDRRCFRQFRFQPKYRFYNGKEFKRVVGSTYQCLGSIVDMAVAVHNHESPASKPGGGIEGSVGIDLQGICHGSCIAPNKLSDYPGSSFACTQHHHVLLLRMALRQKLAETVQGCDVFAEGVDGNEQRNGDEKADCGP